MDKFFWRYWSSPEYSDDTGADLYLGWRLLVYWLPLDLSKGKRNIYWQVTVLLASVPDVCVPAHVDSFQRKEKRPLTKWWHSSHSITLIYCQSKYSVQIIYISILWIILWSTVNGLGCSLERQITNIYQVCYGFFAWLKHHHGNARISFCQTFVTSFCLQKIL